MKKLKIVSLIFLPVVALTLSTLSGYIHNRGYVENAHANGNHDHSGLLEWTSADSLPDSSGNYYLTNDVILSSAWQVPDGTTNLCLNGHYVKQTANASVMRANNKNITLNLYDCGNDTHYYYVDSSTRLGVVVETEEQAIAGNPKKYGSFTGGYITGGQGTDHLGIAPCGGAMYMTGGANVTFKNINLIGNNATFGGCFHNSHSPLTIKGGVFVGNTGNGSAVNADGNAVVDVSDTYITHNDSGFRADINNFTISGKIEVFGNTNYDLERCSANKVFKIGETLENTHPMASSYIFNTPFTSGLSGKGDATNFASASTDYVVKLNDNGEAYLAPAPLATIISGDTVTEYSDLNSAVNAWVDGSTLKLYKDATGQLLITSGTKTLDLNNHVLQNSTFIIIVEGDGAHLNIIDSSTNKTRHYYQVNQEGPASISSTVTDTYFDGGYITGITNGGERAIHIKNGTLVLSGGTVFGNRGGSGAGIAVSGENSHLVIEKDGAVIGNYQYADWSSAGAITSSGSIVMTGGSVRHNSARLGVGGIRCSSGSFTMTGGEVIGNYCKTWIPSGIYFDGTTAANFGGSAKVYDNYYLNVPKDIGICEGDNFINICEPLTDEAKLYICPTNDQSGTHTQTVDPTVMTKNWTTMMGDKDPYKYIKCNPIYTRDAKTLLGNYEVFLKDGEVAVGKVAYTIAFDGNGGTGSMDSAAITTRSYTLPNNEFTPSYKCKFVGWKIDGGDTIYQPGEQIVVDQDTTLVAQWQYMPTVSFSANGGTGTMTDIVLSDSHTFVVPENSFTAPDRYKFVGWKINGKGNLVNPGAEIKVDEDTTLVAQWQYMPTVSFSANGGTGEMSDVILTDDNTFTLPENKFTAPNRYKFIGWKISGETTIRNPGEQIVVEKDTTLVAQWEFIPIVSFSANGGTGTMTDIVLSDSHTFVVPENSFTAPKEMKFIGWKLAKNGVFYSSGDSATFDVDETLVAQWSPIPDEGWSKLNGVIYDHGGINPIARAFVKVYKGNQLLESTFTNDNGEYHLDCPNGIYNLVVEYNELSETTIVEVFGETLKNIRLSNGKNQSLVNVIGEEGIAVGGLDQLANNIRESEAIPADKTLTLAMNIEQKSSESIGDADKFNGVAENHSLRFYDIKVAKTIDKETTNVKTTINVLEIVIPYEKVNKRGLSVYSYHGDELITFVQSDSKADGTFSLDLENGLVKIYTNKFSSFAIGYTPYYRVNLDLSFGIFGGKVNVSLVDKNEEVAYKLENVDVNNVIFDDVAMGQYKAIVSWADGEIDTSLVFNLSIGPNGVVITPIQSN